MACPDRDLDPRVGGDEFLEHLGEHVCADRRGGGDHEVAGRGCHHLLEGIAPVDQGAEGPFCERDPRPARIGQPHAVWRAEKERRAELALQSVKARRQGWLGDEERLGSAADAPPAGDLEEPLDLHELDAVWLPVT